MPVYISEPPETFAERNTREPLTEIDASEVVAWFFEGVKFSHPNGTIHGGLYPGSIKLKHYGPWSIQLPDIGLRPYVDLEDSKERTLRGSMKIQVQRRNVYETHGFNSGDCYFRLILRIFRTSMTRAITFRMVQVSSTLFSTKWTLWMKNSDRRVLSPQHLRKALKDGFTIVHKALLLSCPTPTAANIPTLRTTLIAVEAALTCIFGAFYNRSKTYDFVDLCPWRQDLFEWNGFCSHSPLIEYVAGDLNLDVSSSKQWPPRPKRRIVSINRIMDRICVLILLRDIVNDSVETIEKSSLLSTPVNGKRKISSSTILATSSGSLGATEDSPYSDSFETKFLNSLKRKEAYIFLGFDD